jgi:capsular exopolysaccharide synthesis family protein
MLTEGLPMILEYGEHRPHFANFYRFFTRITHNEKGDNSKRPRVLTVTSATEGEGKSTLSSYLSLTASMSTQEPCLLIDGDLHRPALHKAFGINREEGLSNVISEMKDFRQVVQKSNRDNLSLISAGRAVHNPFELLSLERTKQLFEEFRANYGLVVIDAPPLVPLGDALKLAEYSDGVIMVVRTAKASKEVVRRAVEILNEAHCSLLGVVINDIGEVLPYYYQRSYYGYHYDLSNPSTEMKREE